MLFCPCCDGKKTSVQQRVCPDCVRKFRDETLHNETEEPLQFLNWTLLHTRQELFFAKKEFNIASSEYNTLDIRVTARSISQLEGSILTGEQFKIAFNALKLANWNANDGHRVSARLRDIKDRICFLDRVIASLTSELGKEEKKSLHHDRKRRKLRVWRKNGPNHKRA